MKVKQIPANPCHPSDGICPCFLRNNFKGRKFWRKEDGQIESRPASILVQKLGAVDFPFLIQAKFPVDDDWTTWPEQS